jgi:hypothetical protein
MRLRRWTQYKSQPLRGLGPIDRANLLKVSFRYVVDIVSLHFVGSGRFDRPPKEGPEETHSHSKVRFWQFMLLGTP